MSNAYFAVATDSSLIRFSKHVTGWQSKLLTGQTVTPSHAFCQKCKQRRLKDLDEKNAWDIFLTLDTVYQLLVGISRNHLDEQQWRGTMTRSIDFYNKGHNQNCEKKTFEPWHDKTNKMAVRPAKTQISLGIRPVWSESPLSAWRKLGSLASHWAHSEDSDQTGRMPSCQLVATSLSSFQIYYLPHSRSMLLILHFKCSRVMMKNQTFRISCVNIALWKI